MTLRNVKIVATTNTTYT